MNSLTLRPVAPGDLELVRRWRTDPRLEEFAEEPERAGELIEVDGEPVGWIDPHPAYAPAWREAFGPDVGEAPWTLDLFVVPERWGQGIARAAIRLVTDRCLGSEATSMVVNVARSNEPSRRAFEGAGWHWAATNEDDFLLRYPANADG